MQQPAWRWYWNPWWWALMALLLILCCAFG